MSKEETDGRQKQNLESRKETLTIVFNRLIKGLDVLDPYSAVMFTTPLADILCNAVMELEHYNEQKSVNDLINNAFKPSHH